MIWIVLLIVVAFLLWYALRGRAWLKEQPWAKPFFSWVEPIERRLYQKSETLLVGRLLSVGGFLVTGYDALAVVMPSLDMTPITNRLLASVPEDLRGTVLSGVLMGLGLLISWLRKRTSKPLEVVALPEDVPHDVAVAVAKVEAATAQVVEAVAEAKAEGSV